MMFAIPNYKITWKVPGYTHLMVVSGSDDVMVFVKTLFFNGVSEIDISEETPYTDKDRYYRTITTPDDHA